MDMSGFVAVLAQFLNQKIESIRGYFRYFFPKFQQFNTKKAKIETKNCLYKL